MRSGHAIAPLAMRQNGLVQVARPANDHITIKRAILKPKRFGFLVNCPKRFSDYDAVAKSLYAF
jgi:hypothetical protein